jgi:cytidine deaminase
MSGAPSPSDLVAAARSAAANAYAPYSRFAVGAALLLADGAVVTAANMENASYGLSLCAEAAALAAANGAGRLRDIVAMAVSGGPIDGDGSTIVRPCGRCRQLLAEAAQIGDRDILVHCAGATGDAIETHPLSALLPLAFGPGDLA